MTLSFAERFRTWYAYERDCNAKALTMLGSVPPAARASPQFERAVRKMAHLVAARHMWLFRLGVAPDRPDGWFPSIPFERLPEALGAVEERWMRYLDSLTDEQIASECRLVREDGSTWRWPLVDLLTQLFGHAWYHRGQVALLVKALGGVAVDTDYIFWNPPQPAEDTA